MQASDLQDDDHPIDDCIRALLARNQDPDGPKGCLNVIRAALLEYATQAYDRDGGVFTGRFDGHVRQLVGVLDELKRAGQCVIAGRVVRPG